MKTPASRGAWAQQVALAAAGLTAALLLATAWAWLASQPEIDDPRATRLTQALAVEAGATYPGPPPAADAAWSATPLPDNWDGRRPAYAGYVWYRLQVPPDLAQHPRPTIYLPAAGMNAELWVNGTRLGGPGRMTPQLSRHFYTPMLFELPRSMLLGDGRPVRIDVLVVGHPGYRCGLAPAWAGDYTPLQAAARWRGFWQNTGTLITIVLNLAIGVYVLLIWWRERSHTAFAWFGAAVIVWALRNLNYVVTDPPLPDLLFAELCVSGAAWFTALFAIFALRFAQAEDPAYRGPRWLVPAALAYALLASAYFLSADDYAQANAGFAAFALVGIGFTVWSQWRLVRLAWAVRRSELVAIAFSAMMYLVLLVNDYAIGIDRSSLGEVFIRQYAALPLFAAITATLARRYLDALREARETAASLHSQVQAQRVQIERSFDALKDAEREQARAQERARLMGDLHDGLGLHLVTALRQARSAVATREAVALTLQDCLDDLRVAIDSLDTQERDPLSLLGSLRFRMAPRFQSMGLRLDWQVALDIGELPALDAEGALQLLRIVQEALTNALKHSGAKVVLMSLSQSAAGTVIEVADDGVGFDPVRVKPGRGMGQLQARAARLGAQLMWAAGSGPGTVLRLVLPARS